MHIQEQPSIEHDAGKVEALMRAHNFMQFQLITESGIDDMAWVDTYAGKFRETVTITDDDKTKPERADIMKLKQEIEQACLESDIALAVSLIRQLVPDFPFRAAA